MAEIAEDVVLDPFDLRGGRTSGDDGGELAGSAGGSGDRPVLAVSDEVRLTPFDGDDDETAAAWDRMDDAVGSGRVGSTGAGRAAAVDEAFGFVPSRRGDDGDRRAPVADIADEVTFDPFVLPAADTSTAASGDGERDRDDRAGLVVADGVTLLPFDVSGGRASVGGVGESAAPSRSGDRSDLGVADQVRFTPVEPAGGAGNASTEVAPARVQPEPVASDGSAAGDTYRVADGFTFAPGGSLAPPPADRADRTTTGTAPGTGGDRGAVAEGSGSGTTSERGDDDSERTNPGRDVFQVIGGTLAGVGNAALAPLADRYRSSEEEFFDDPTRAERAGERFREAGEALGRLLPGDDEQGSQRAASDGRDADQDTDNPWRLTTFDEENWPPEFDLEPQALAYAALGVGPTIGLTANQRAIANGTSVVQELAPASATVPRSATSDLFLTGLPLEVFEGPAQNAMARSVASAGVILALDEVGRAVSNRLPDLQRANIERWLNRNNTGQPVTVPRGQPPQLNSGLSRWTMGAIAPVVTAANLAADSLSDRLDLEPEPTDENNNRFYASLLLDSVATGAGVFGPIAAENAVNQRNAALQAGVRAPSLTNAARQSALAFVLPAAQTFAAGILTQEPPDTSDPIYRTTRAGIEFAQDAAGAVGHSVFGEPSEEDGNAVNALQTLGNAGRAAVTPVASAVNRAFPNVIANADESLDYLFTGDPVDLEPIVSEEARQTAGESRRRAQEAWQQAREGDPETRWGAGAQLLANAAYLVGQGALGTAQGLASPITDSFRTDTDDFLEVPTQGELARDRFAEANQAVRQMGSAIGDLRNPPAAQDDDGGSPELDAAFGGPLFGSQSSVGGLQLGTPRDQGSPGLGEFTVENPLSDLLPGGGEPITVDGSSGSLGDNASPALWLLDDEIDPEAVGRWVDTPNGQVFEGAWGAGGRENLVLGDDGPGDDTIRVSASVADADAGDGGQGGRLTPMLDLGGDASSTMVVDVEPIDSVLGLPATEYMVYFLNGDQGVYTGTGDLVESVKGDPPPTVATTR